MTCQGEAYRDVSVIRSVTRPDAKDPLNRFIAGPEHTGVVLRELIVGNDLTGTAADQGERYTIRRLPVHQRRDLAVKVVVLKRKGVII